ncbi:MAG: aspartate aminotransferase family protein, partial [Anaerolineales bacterium]|nr:aspartate aminotransferase family protein [Anaerolineales bacterium]
NTAHVALETLHLLRQLFGLSDAHVGSFVTGATMSNFVGLALARQWVGRQQGVDVAQQGAAALAPFPVFSAAPHASIYKALAMLGLGRDALQPVAALPGREAVDVAALAAALAAQNGRACIVVANAGTVNTVDFDDLAAIAALRPRYPFWLHVDAAFGGFAACTPRYGHLVNGWDAADSICIDGHKWLNVPYDAAMQFTRHPRLQLQVFQNAAVYLGAPAGEADFVHRTPENSRRFRALPAWFTLLAYGRDGYRELVERNCDQAQALGARLAANSQFELLAPVRLNGVVFTLAGRPPMAAIRAFLDWLRDDGRLFLTPTQFQGVPAIRISLVNWQTAAKDVDVAWAALQAAAAHVNNNR